MNTKLFLGMAAYAGLFAALVASAPLRAYGDEAPIRFGGGLSITSPQGGPKTYESKQGFGFSLFGEKELQPDRSLRGRLEYLTFGEDTHKIKREDWYDTDEWEEKCSANATVAMLDFVYRLESHDHGIYLFGGAGFVQGTFKKEGDFKKDKDYYAYYGFKKEDLTAKGSGLGFSLGAGYNMNEKLGLELSYTTASGIATSKVFSIDEDWYETEPVKLSFTCIQVSLRYRF